MSCPSYKVDSNEVGLRYAIEDCLKQLLPATAGARANGTLTLSAAGDPGDTAQVAGTTFTLSSAPAAATDVLIGATAGDTAANLAAAIEANIPQVTAEAAGAVVTVTAVLLGTAGNSIALAGTGDIGAGAANLSGGVDQVTDQVWYPLEPNSYGDMGANVTTVARNPINPSRQRQKGVVTDLEASASFQMDLTGQNHIRLLQSYMFALAREKATTRSLNSPQVPVTAVTTVTGYAPGTAFASAVSTGSLVLAEGFALPANNGLKLVTGTGAGTVLAAGLAAESTPPTAARLTHVGIQRAAGDMSISIVGGQVRLNSAALNMTTLGLIPGEWIYVGGDAVATQFDSGHGFARVDAITTGYLVLGKTSWDAVTDVGSAKTIQIFMGLVIRNETERARIARTSIQFERTLAQDAVGPLTQYVIGSIANEMTLNVPQAEKVTVELGFIACDAETRKGSDGIKPGARPELEAADAFNTSSDLRRIAFSIAGDPQPLFMYATDLTLTVNNNASGSKALGVLGNFDVNVGVFDVSGSVTAYFQDLRAVQAVRDNADVTMDAILVKNNMGIVWDIPLMALGNGMVAVEQDQAVTVPLDTMAAQSSFGHTLLYMNFPYLPSVA